MTRPTIILTPMIEAPHHKPDWFWLAPVVCFLAVATPLCIKPIIDTVFAVVASL